MVAWRSPASSVTGRPSYRVNGVGTVRILVLSAVAAAAFVVAAGEPAHAATLSTGARSLEAVNQAGRYVRHMDYLGRLDPVTSSSANQVKLDATFTVVNGLASPKCYSFQTRAGMFLRHRDYRLRVDPNTGDATFRADATFCAVDGSVSGSVALTSYNYPDRRIRHRDFALWLDAYQDTAAFRADSSFRLAAPWAPRTTKGPVIPGLFADPHLAMFNGRYYLYPTTDGYASWAGTYYKAFSSADLVNWTDHGVILDHGPDVTWADNSAWARRSRVPTAATTSTSAGARPAATLPNTSAWPSPTARSGRSATRSGGRWSAATSSPAGRRSTRWSSPTTTGSPTSTGVRASHGRYDSTPTWSPSTRLRRG